jgi:hypothetical protein
MLATLILLLSVCLGSIQQIHLSLVSNQDSTQVLVMWANTLNTSSNYVEYGVKTGKYNYYSNATSQQYSYAANVVPNYVSPFLFSAMLINAIASGTFYYRIVSSGTTSSEYTFRILPRGQQTARIGFVGDVGADGNSSQTVATLSSLNTDAVVHAGDLSCKSEPLTLTLTLTLTLILTSTSIDRR